MGTILMRAVTSRSSSIPGSPTLERLTPDRASRALRPPGPPATRSIHAGPHPRRYLLARRVVRAGLRLYSRVEVEGLDRLPQEPAILCFNHLNWADPLVFLGVLPAAPRVYFFGPEQENMRHGVRNRLMDWAGLAVPFKPHRRGLLNATRRVETIVRGGGQLAIAGEGRIHAGEDRLLALSEGPAFFALRLGVPVVPLAVNGTGWLGFRRRVRVRVGCPIVPEPGSGPSATSVAALTEETWQALQGLVADFPDTSRPWPVGAWFTEVFNDWPEGSRAAAERE